MLRSAQVATSLRLSPPVSALALPHLSLLPTHHARAQLRCYQDTKVNVSCVPLRESLTQRSSPVVVSDRFSLRREKEVGNKKYLSCTLQAYYVFPSVLSCTACVAKFLIASVLSATHGRQFFTRIPQHRTHAVPLHETLNQLSARRMGAVGDR